MFLVKEYMMKELKNYLKNRLTRLNYEKSIANDETYYQHPQSVSLDMLNIDARIEELNNLAANFKIKLKKL